MRTHKVTSISETLGTIAVQYYKNPRLWQAIYDHNEDILDQHGNTLNHLTPGIVLVIPYLQGSGHHWMPELLLPTEDNET